MSAALAHELINSESERAAAAAKGSQEGKSVGAHFRDTTIHASDKARWPIEVPREVLAAAAPKATAYARDKAGTPPLAAKCHIEEVAAGVSDGLRSLPAGLPEGARGVGRRVRTRTASSQPGPLDESGAAARPRRA